MTTSLYVGNLSYDTTEEALRTLFAAYGDIEAVRLITDRYTGRSKGFAFVEMSADEAAEEAIQALNGKEVDGRELKVDKAKPRSDRGRGGRERQRRW
ncbi:MAG: RNA recognition motif domain-containing protein [Anaerolineae bacterium]